MANAHFNAPVHAFRTISAPRCDMAFAFMHHRCRNFAGCATPQEISYGQRLLTHLIKTKRVVVVGMSAIGPKRTSACALYMSAFQWRVAHNSAIPIMSAVNRCPRESRRKPETAPPWPTLLNKSCVRRFAFGRCHQRLLNKLVCTRTVMVNATG